MLMDHPCVVYWVVVSTPLKNMKVSWDDYSQYIYMENKTYSKPPTRWEIMGWFTIALPTLYEIAG
jgi:hypothetical protein